MSSPYNLRKRIRPESIANPPPKPLPSPKSSSPKSLFLLFKDLKTKRGRKKKHDKFFFKFFDDKDDDKDDDSDDSDDSDDDSDDDFDSFNEDDSEEFGDNSETEIDKSLKRINEKRYLKLKEKLVGENCSEKKYFKSLDLDAQEKVIQEIKKIVKSFNGFEKPDTIRILESTNIPERYKFIAMSKIKILEEMMEDENYTSEYFKIKQWVDTFLKIPFGIYSTINVLPSGGREYILNARKVLDNAVYGMEDAKSQILQMLAQWISNPKSIGNSFALYGPPGIGKTTLIKDGLSKILNRPFFFLPMGGSTDISFYQGHSYTFEGSTWGRIVDILIEAKTMNPIFYFDELDKISKDTHGESIEGMLMHLTDSSQNELYHDRYFSGIDFDLSKSLFVFSYNDDTKINPILKDRMYRIECGGYKKSDKVEISKKFLLPYLDNNIGFEPGSIKIDCIEYIIETFTDNEKGVRNLKRCLETIYKKINLMRFEETNVTFPFLVDKDNVTSFLKNFLEKNVTSSMFI